MSSQTYRSPGRLLAPAALVAVVVALVLVVLGSSRGSDTETRESGERPQTTVTSPAARPRAPRGVYTVRSGDTLDAIAARNGTTVERLLELNPELDARTLVTGQRIKLRQ